MPSTPVTPTDQRSSASSVGAASDECRQNAMKYRRESDWFSHDSANTASASRPQSAMTPGRTPNKTSQESEQWFRFDTNGKSPDALPSSRAVAQGRCFGGSQQDWYKHGDDVPDPPSLEKQSKQQRSRRSACNDVKQKTSDPNEWFRHDHDPNQKTDRRPGKKSPREAAATTSLWAPDGTSCADLTPRPKSRLTTSEADDNYRRDKLGSSDKWFSHEHPVEEESASATSSRSRRGGGSVEGGEIAGRLKGESEEWFRHDLNQNYTSPPPAFKGTSPFAKELMERGQGREIKQIFSMEENLKTTWNAPPPSLLLDDDQFVTSNQLPAVDNSGQEADVAQKMDTLSINGKQDKAHD